MKTSVALLNIVICTTSPAFVLAHADILVSRSSNQIVTGGYDFDLLPGDPVIPPSLRVFGYEFGETPGQPDFAQDPGFVSLPGVFLAGTHFTLHNLGDLRYWNGTGEVSFIAPLHAESLVVEKGSSSMSIGAPGGSLVVGTTPGFTSGQDLHEHLDVSINGSPAVTDGIYLIKLALSGSNGLQDSDPFWIVYNHGMDDTLHDAAIEWVQNNLVPEPAALLLMGLASLALGLRSRRALA